MTSKQQTDHVVNGINGHSNSPHKSAGKRHKPAVVSRGSKLIVMLAMTFLFFVVEMVCGYVSHSMALIADSFHMLSDVMALGIAYGCMKIAERDTKQNTFGWVRAEVLGALINGVFLLALCFTIFIESITRLVEPEMIKEPRNVLVVGVIGFVINLIGMLMFHSHSHSHISSRASEIHSGHKDTIEELESKHLIGSHQDRAMAMAELDAAEDSLMTGDSQRKRPAGHADQLNMRGVFLHIVSDAIGSVIVIATALVSWLVPGQEELKLYMDPALSIILVLLMVFTTFPLVKETALILLQTTPKFIDIEKIKEDLCNMDGIVAVHEFHVWRLVGERIIATVHIRFLSLKHYLLAAERIRALFHDNHIHSATVQPEFSDLESSSGSENDCNYACLPRCLLAESALTCCTTTNQKKSVNSTALVLSETSVDEPTIAADSEQQVVAGGDNSNNV